jgi:hypothetical protein
VYAFGVIVWEMLSGVRAWDKLTPAQVMLAVALQQQTLSFAACPLPELPRCLLMHARSLHHGGACDGSSMAIAQFVSHTSLLCTYDLCTVR